MKGNKNCIFFQILNLLREPEYIIIPVNKLCCACIKILLLYSNDSVSKVISESKKEEEKNILSILKYFLIKRAKEVADQFQVKEFVGLCEFFN